MTKKISLRSAIDGFDLPALSAGPSGAPKGGVVVIQEIFGLTDHIGDMTERFAAAGYQALAPGLFDRIERDFHAGLNAEGFDRGRSAVMSTPWPQVIADVQAAIDALPKPCYVTGFCYGGAVSWLAAVQCTGLSAASCFYGRLIVNMLNEKPKVPVMLHYGAHDAAIPMSEVEKVRAASPESPLHIYDAGHGFCRQGSHDFNAEARDLAMTRTLDWFARWT